MKLLNFVKTKGVFASHYGEKITPKLSYKIFKLCSKIEQEEGFYKQKLAEIANEFGERDNEGNLVINDAGNIVFSEDELEEAQKALEALHGIEVEAPNIRFTLDELEEIKLSVADIAVIKDFIEDGEGDE